MKNIIREQNKKEEKNKITIDNLEQYIQDSQLDKDKIQEQLEQFIYQTEQNNLHGMVSRLEEELKKREDQLQRIQEENSYYREYIQAQRVQLEQVKGQLKE